MKTFKRITLCGLIAVILLLNSASAQNCTGTVSTGQNLVTNGDFSNLYTGWTHDPGYSVYTPCTGCWSTPGNIYAGAIPKDFNSDAFTNFQDHSPSGDNNFLMVDGICTPGIDLWRQSNIPIIPNTNYYFSVWITSLDTLTPYGTLNFNINGVDLPTKITAPAVAGQWVRFPGVVWNSGLNPPSSITISIQNTQTNGCDHAVDFGIDDITFTQGCDFGVTGPTPNLGPDFPICGRTLPFTINPNFRAATAASPNLTYTWYKDGVQQTKGMGPPFYNFSVNGPGTYSLCVDSAGSCPLLDAVVINNNTQSPTRAWSPDSVFCAGSLSTVRLRIVGGSGSNLIWYSGSCGGTQVGSNTTGAEVTVPAPSVSTTYFARWISSTCSTTACASVTVTPLQPPVPSNAGLRQDLCNATSAALSGNTPSPTGAKGTWSVVSGTGNIASPNDPHSSVSNLVAGDLVLKWTISNSPCPTSSSQVTVHVDVLSPPVITGSSFTQCATATGVVFSTTVNDSPSSIYSWTKTGSLVITGSSNNTATVNIGTQGGTLTVTETKGTCSASASSNIISVLPPDPLPVSGLRQNLCNATTTTLDANAPSVPGATGLWSVLSGNGNVTAPNDPNSTVTGLTEGNLVLKWTISNAPCPSSSSKDTIHVDKLSNPVITGASANQCATATGVVYSTTVNHFPLSTYNWTKTGSLIITNHPNNSAILDVGASGGTLTVTETKGACSLSSSINIISVPPLNQTSGGPDQQICNATQATLAAVPATPPGVGFWKIIGGSGSISAADTLKPNATVYNLVEGDLILRWTVRNSPCADSTDDVIIHESNLSAPVITGASLNQCASATGVIYSTTNDNSPVSTYSWSKSGSLVITGSSNNKVTVDVGLAGGTLTVTETKGACSFSDSKIINSFSVPDPASAGADRNICNLSSVTLSANTPTAPSEGFWTILNGTGYISPSEKNNPYATLSGLIEGDVHLTWTIRNSPCPDTTDEIIVHKDVLSAPMLSMSSPFDTCAYTNGVYYSTTVNNSPLSTYTWSSSGVPNTLSIVSTNENTAQVNVGDSGGTIIVTVNKGACSLSASKIISITPDIADVNAGPDQTVCINNTVLQASQISIGRGVWSVTQGTGVFADPTDPHSSITNISNGPNIYTWTVKGCGGPLSDDVQVTLGNSNMIIGPLIGPTDTLCVGTPRTISLAVAGGSSHYYYVWRSSDSSFNTIKTYSPVVVVPLINSTTYYVYAVDSINNGCRSDQDSITVYAISKQNLTINNLMTPNDDKMNDRLIIRDVETMQNLLPGASLEVFNEWGSKVFQSHSYDNTWEAPGLTDGIYYYHLKAGCGSGVYKGWVQILR